VFRIVETDGRSTQSFTHRIRPVTEKADGHICSYGNEGWQ